MNKNRGFAYAFGNISNEDLDAEPINIDIDPDDPKVMAQLTIPEYVELKNAQETGMQAEVATEGFSDHWQNFKNRFENEIKNEDAYVDTLQENFEKLQQIYQAASEKEVGDVPISLFANLYYLTSGPKIPANASQMKAMLQENGKLIAYLKNTYVNILSAHLKEAQAIMELGKSDPAKAAQMSYSLSAKHPYTGLDAFTTKTDTKKIAVANSKEVKTVTSKVSEPFMGGFQIYTMPQLERSEYKPPRGNYVGGEYTQMKAHDKIQIKAASRSEGLELIKLSETILADLITVLDHRVYGDMQVLNDRTDSFFAAHRSWSKYPEDERKQVLMAYNCVTDVENTIEVLHYATHCTRRAIRAIELYLRKSLHRMS